MGGLNLLLLIWGLFQSVDEDMSVLYNETDE